jgi:hypothetical protein
MELEWKNGEKLKLTKDHDFLKLLKLEAATSVPNNNLKVGFGFNLFEILQGSSGALTNAFVEVCRFTFILSNLSLELQGSESSS